MKEIRIAVIVAGACLATPVLAGSVLELEMTEYNEDPPIVSTMELSMEGNSSRMEISTADPRRSEGSSGGMIFRGDSREMVAIDHEQKQYYVLDEASMDQMATKMSQAMQEMQKSLEGMPPEQRAMVEQMMKQHMPQAMQQPAGAPATLHKTGEDDSINGFDCEYYDVRRQDRTIRELCVTSWDDIPGGEDAADAMLEMAGFFERMAKKFSEGAGMNFLGDQQEMFAHMKELDGYPVLTREFDDAGAIESETRLNSATTEDLEAALFNPPAGYREMQVGM